MEHIWIAWDIFAVLLVAYCIGKGVRYGFLRMAVSFAGYTLSAYTARRYSAPLAQTLYRDWLEQPLRRSVAARLEQAMRQGVDSHTLADALPAWMRGLAAVFSNPEAAYHLEIELGAERLADLVLEQVLREAILWLAEGVLFLAIFTALAWVIRRVAYLLSGVHRIPVIGTLNCLAGGLLGVLEAALLLIAAGVLAQLLIGVSGGGTDWMSGAIIDSTYIFRVFYAQILPPVG